MSERKRDPVKKAGQAVISVIYGIGALTVLILLVLVLSRAQGTPDPDAMLPMELHEAAGLLLALGFFPMLGASILFYFAHGVYKRGHRIRNTVLLSLPAAACLVFFLFWAGIWVIGMINMVIHWEG